MIKKLRRKFIFCAICSVAAVLGLIIALINIANYRNVIKNAEELIYIISENGGEFPGAGGQPGETGKFSGGGIGERDRKFPGRQMSPETPFQTRYFTAEVSPAGEVTSVDIGRIASVSSEEASEYVGEILKKGKTSGFYGNYRYGAFDLEEGKMYVFLDCSKELSTFRSFLTASVLVSLGGLVLVLILVVLISGIVLRPAEESVSKQKRFITDAGHEIKTPLTIIDANTEVLEMESGENEWTKSIRNQVKRLTSMTEKLVFLSRMDEENSLKTAAFDLSGTVEENACPFEAVAQANGKTLETHIEKDLTLIGDSSMIGQLVSILLDNAVKYADEGGSISLVLRSSGKNRILEVKNSFSGAKQGRLDQFFERFYRADPARSSQAGGCGIGLSVAYEIVKAHKGKISAVSDDGRSVRITAVLPGGMK